MHSRVFEIGSAPIPLEERASLSDLPDWFFEVIADYGVDIPDAQREGELDWFIGRFDGNCHRDGEKITFKQQTKEDYFKAKHEKFLTAVAALMNCSLDDFAGSTSNTDLNGKVYALTSAYNDKFGFYVYDWEGDGLCTMDQWLRSADLSQEYYIGGIIDYHW